MKSTIVPLILLFAGIFSTGIAGAQSSSGNFGTASGAGYTLKGTI